MTKPSERGKGQRLLTTYLAMQICTRLKSPVGGGRGEVQGSHGDELTKDVEEEVEHAADDLGDAGIGRDVHEELPKDGIEADRLEEDDQVDEKGLSRCLIEGGGE